MEKTMMEKRKVHQQQKTVQREEKSFSKAEEIMDKECLGTQAVDTRDSIARAQLKRRKKHFLS